MKKFFNSTKLNDYENNFFNSLSSELNISEESALFAGFPYFDNDLSDYVIKGLLIYGGGVIIFYNTDEELDSYKRYVIQQLLKSASISKKIGYDFDNYIYSSKVGNLIIDIKREKKFDSNDVRTIVATLQRISSLTKKDPRKPKKADSLGKMIAERSEIEANLDEEQFKFVYDESYNNSNIRIRGLAGCGKTILLAEKMAYLHYKDKEKRLAYIFYTKSLKQSIDKYFNAFYAHVSSNGDVPDKTMIKIMHGWGSSQYPGLYSIVSNRIGISNVSYEDNPNFDKLCEQLIKTIVDLRKEDGVRMFDYILIDEAQDFYLSFFRLAKMCLKPGGKIIYAYDELQALNETNKRIPTKKEIFGNDICRDIDLSKCYRTPKEILVTAHALGLGIYHFNDQGDRELINAVQEKSVWKAIGYNSNPIKMVDGENVSLSRETNIPNRLGDNAIVCKDFNDSSEQFEYVINEITNLIYNQEVNADDILIIDLDSRNININYSLFQTKYLDFFSADHSIGPFETSIINKESGYDFRIKGKVSYTTIFRAKGNEANIVFVINSNNSDAVLSYNRNRLFTAMTRAKFKVYILGLGQHFINTIIKEINLVKEHNYKLEFRYPTKEEIEKCYRKVYEDNQTIEKVDNVLELFSGLDDDGIKALLSKMTEEEKERLLQQISNDNRKKPEKN